MELRRPWTAAEVRALRARKNEPVRTLAEDFDRTAGAVRQKASSLGIAIGANKKSAKPARKSKRARRAH